MNIANGLKSGFETVIAVIILIAALGFIIVAPFVLVQHFTGNEFLPLIAVLFHALFWAGFLDGVNSE